MNEVTKTRNAVLGLALGIITIPLVFICWPIFLCCWMWQETDDDD